MKAFLLIAIAGLSGFALEGAAAAEHKTSSPEAQKKLRTYIDSDVRPQRHKDRDQHRRPFETLTFCGVEPDMTVVEIWPGGQGGWYRRIIEPFVTDNGGHYTPVASRSAFSRARLRAFPMARRTLSSFFAPTAS